MEKSVSCRGVFTGKMGGLAMDHAAPCLRCTDRGSAAAENTPSEEVTWALRCFSSPMDGLSKAWKKIAEGQHLMCPNCKRDQRQAADMLCVGCAALLPTAKFSLEMVKLWQEGETTE